MNTRYSALAALILILAGCASLPSGQTASASKALSWISYTCGDGQVVQAAYPDTNTAQVKIEGVTHTLHVAISGSGARYIGEGWQWWTKGMHDGMLAPLSVGETIASAPGTACHAG